jgi:putative SOS response-associated peptidase YedK
MTLTEKSLAKVAEELQATFSAQDVTLYKPRYNVAPSDQHWVVRGSEAGRELVPARWAFGRRDGRPMINARSESLHVGRKGPLSKALEERRCVVPADGFFEWTGPRNARQPLWFHRRDGGLLYLAGLWEEGPDGKPQFVVLTTEPNKLVARVHDRMPALLTPDRVNEWLAKPAPELLGPAPEALLVADAVSPRVNDVRNDDPGVLETPRDGGPKGPTEPPQLKLI